MFISQEYALNQNGYKRLPSPQNAAGYKYWVNGPDRALVQTFYESNGCRFEETVIEKVRVLGNMRNTARLASRIKAKWEDLPRRIRAVLRNDNVDRNDRYGVIREYMGKYPDFFESSFQRDISLKAGSTGGERESGESQSFDDTGYVNWVEGPERALVKTFYESHGIFDKTVIEKIRVFGKMRNIPEVNARIQDKWDDLPRRVRAVLLNERVVENDKYGAIREYVCKNPTFFAGFKY
eukprot:gene33782-45238_t